GAGARGLAGLFASADVARPLIRFGRRDLARYARTQGLVWIEDPSNDAPRFFRNRVRHDVLPAMRRVNPGIDRELLDIGRRAARWRTDMEALANASVEHELSDDGRALEIVASALASHESASLAVLWPALAAKVGLALDRRGTERLASFTRVARVGSRIPLSGGWQVHRARDRFQLRRQTERLAPAELRAGALERGMTWDSWSFQPAAQCVNGDPWTAWLPTDEPLEVRAWRPGDAMVVRAG